MPPIVEVLGPQHDRLAFSCGVDSLDVYIKRQAGQDVRRHLTVCYVLGRADNRAIIGYYTLSATAIEPSSLPPETVSRLPRYAVLPAILLGRLAVDSRFAGQGMGEILLVDALRRAARSGIGVLVVVVDALDGRAASFYERFQFQRFADTPERLFLPISVAQTLFPEP